MSAPATALTSTLKPWQQSSHGTTRVSRWALDSEICLTHMAHGAWTGPFHVLGVFGLGRAGCRRGQANGEEPVRHLPSAGRKRQSPSAANADGDAKAATGDTAPIGAGWRGLVLSEMCGMHGSRGWGR